MHMALNADEWLQLNTLRCERLSACITIARCEANKERSPGNGGWLSAQSGDMRCEGCNGLYDQAEPLVDALNRSLQVALEEIIDMDLSCPERVGNAGKIGKHPADEYDCDDLEPLLLEEELLALFPELAEEDEPEEQIERVYREYQTAAPRRAIYKDRCKRCGGYMENTREWGDDNVFHCLCCGWRTGPEYELNRETFKRCGYVG